MFDQHADEALQRSEYRPVQHHGGMFYAVLGDVRRTQPVRSVEIDLQRAALPIPTNGVAQDEFELGSVERAFAGIERIRYARSFGRLLERPFSAVPDVIPADPVLRTSRQF